MFRAFWTLAFAIFPRVANINAFSIAPLPPTVTQFTPVTVSWIRESGDPTQWFLEKQHVVNLTQTADFVKGTSEPLSVENPESKSGTIVISFTVDPGPFRLLAFGGEFNTADNIQTDQTRTSQIFTGTPNFVVVKASPTASSSASSSTSTSSIKSLSSSITTKAPNSGTFTAQGTMKINTTSSSSTTALSPESSTTTTSTTNSSQSSSVVLPENAHTSTSNHHIPIIIGSVLGGITFLLFLAILYLIRRRRTRRAELTAFHRDMMIRSKESEQYPDLKDSQVFNFDDLPTSGMPSLRKKSTAISRKSFSSVGSSLEEDEYTPALTGYSSSRNQSPVDGSVPPLPSTRTRLPARTDRQMYLQEKIMDLRQQMIGKRNSGAGRELSVLREQIRKLEELQNSDWALELTDVAPSG